MMTQLVQRNKVRAEKSGPAASRFWVGETQESSPEGKEPERDADLGKEIRLLFRTTEEMRIYNEIKEFAAKERIPMTEGVLALLREPRLKKELREQELRHLEEIKSLLAQRIAELSEDRKSDRKLIEKFIIIPVHNKINRMGTES